MPEILSLSTMLGSYPKTAPLKAGAVTSPRVRLDFADVSVAQKAFKDVVRAQKYDVAELAIMTFLQARDAGTPYLLLPFVMNGNFHHKSILCRADDELGPGDLAGRKVAMRAYSQTTPTWVRGILADEYGVRLEDVRWLSQEEAHVEVYQEPAWVTRVGADRSLEAMLRAGEVDAIIAGSGLSGEPGIRPLIPEPAHTAADWHRRTGVIPINHVVVVRQSLVESHPDAVREVFRMLCEARAATDAVPDGANGPDLQPIGFDKLARSLETAVRYAHEQKLIHRRHGIAELYGGVAGILD